MYSLTIHFGPNAMVWSFMFKEKEKVEAQANNVSLAISNRGSIAVLDDFGQTAMFDKETIHAYLVEDLDLVEGARIERSLYNARGEVRARQRAATDATIRQGMGNQGASVLTPFRQ
jgi:hypothetical protein